MKWYDDGSIVSNPGDPIHVLYTPKVNDDGSIELIENGKENKDDKIQSEAASCDLRLIVQKYIDGDISVLNQRTLSFGDTTEYPKTYADMLQLQINAKIQFDKLPKDVKEKFDNDVNKFFATAGTEEWYEKVGYKKTENEEKTVEVENNES